MYCVFDVTVGAAGVGGGTRELCAPRELTGERARRARRARPRPARMRRSIADTRSLGRHCLASRSKTNLCLGGGDREAPGPVGKISCVFHTCWFVNHVLKYSITKSLLSAEMQAKHEAPASQLSGTTLTRLTSRGVGNKFTF